MLALLGCASPPADQGFDDIQPIAAQRAGAIVHWNGHTPGDQAIANAVNRLLSKPLTAEAAVQIALLNNQHLQARFEDLGIAQADLVQAGLLKNPVFDIGVRFPDRAPAGTYLDFAAGEDFLDILLIPARKKLAAAQFEQVKASIANDILALAAETRAAFYDYQAAAQTLALRRTMADAAAAGLDTARKLHDAGNINDLALANQRAQAIRSRADLIDAQESEADARENICRLLGLTASQSNWIAAPLPDLPEADGASADLESLAISQREDLTAARDQIIVQARTLGLTADYRFFSDFTIGPEFERETDGQWRIGPMLSFPLPLFDTGNAKIARASAELRQKELECVALTIDIQSQVRSAAAKLRFARQRVILYRDEVLPAQRDVLHQTELQYNGMYTGVFELLEAKSAEVDADRQLIESLRDYWTARANLELATGGRLSAPATRPTANGVPQ